MTQIQYIAFLYKSRCPAAGHWLFCVQGPKEMRKGLQICPETLLSARLCSIIFPLKWVKVGKSG